MTWGSCLVFRIWPRKLDSRLPLASPPYPPAHTPHRPRHPPRAHHALKSENNAKNNTNTTIWRTHVIYPFSTQPLKPKKSQLPKAEIQNCSKMDSENFIFLHITDKTDSGGPRQFFAAADSDTASGSTTASYTATGNDGGYGGRAATLTALQARCTWINGPGQLLVAPKAPAKTGRALSELRLERAHNMARTRKIATRPCIAWAVGSPEYALAALAAARPDQPRATMINLPIPGAPPPPSPPPPPPPPSSPPPLDKNGSPGPTDRTDIPRPDPETDTTTRPPDPRSANSPSWAETGTTNVDGQAATRALNAAAARPDAKIFACGGGLRGSGKPPGGPTPRQ